MKAITTVHRKVKTTCLLKYTKRLKNEHSLKLQKISLEVCFHTYGGVGNLFSLLLFFFFFEKDTSAFPPQSRSVI